jgi:hypothetical protein
MAGKTNERWTAWNKGRALEKGDALLVVSTTRTGVNIDHVGTVTSIQDRGAVVYLDVADVKMCWTFAGEATEPHGWITSKQPPNWQSKMIWRSSKKLHPRG